MNRFIAVAALCAASVLLISAPAAAHSQLVASTPSADETVTALPAQFSITMNEDLLDLSGDGTGFGLQVVDTAGRYWGDGCLTIDGPTLSMGSSLGDPGTYRLIYQVVSEDGHPVSAELSFTWAGEATGPGSDTPPVCGQTPTTFSPTPTPTPTPTDTPTPAVTSAPDTASAPPVLPIALGVVGALALIAIIVLAVVRQRRP